jgi:hypothetical protein
VGEGGLVAHATMARGIFDASHNGAWPKISHFGPRSEWRVVIVCSQIVIMAPGSVAAMQCKCHFGAILYCEG